ncbi:Pls/PosA family non-ribosomal peptide synthetase [Corynebacterium aquatimens]|uniref:Non-ribosomal peptide synthetase-like protein n=1 Tax=Corynebacterium aquatimens TaxID=1190508 RepID=A0A931E0B1_9CORY|nr:Pls/PosA family non-ribosomal peptide synthetase [Corynebacterium aquatimens]MBG6122359.1 non-ribosomal peptide synthetase-like protein [Corynebacterium aquatimens]WJY65098.1 Dimodular nonribosomal peptide synthase [Corynebacterium aquatimens]
MSNLLRSQFAPEPRTLVDVFRATASAYPDAAALDDGDILTYSELLAEVESLASKLNRDGIGRGDRVGIRMSSGSRDLYISILATLFAGAAYVPVDADDPDERAETVFTEAKIGAMITDAGVRVLKPRTTSVGVPASSSSVSAPGSSSLEGGYPTLNDDAWIIFTSGSTGTPKGVAVTHRSAAAFVDAEARLFCQDNPLGPEDRVLAGLSVAFDASCEEMWLAWGHGACLVPAPRELVRSGQDLGPWLIRRDITVVSTVPTLAGLWPAEALDNVRLLIVGGEACSAELVERLATGEREMWNTYGPTEATVVACATRLFPGQPVSIGWALDGWDLRVVRTDDNGTVSDVPDGEVGELVIGGVGLARYLDPEKDAEKFAPMEPWERAYRSGDHVRAGENGLEFIGRVDDQVKIGGRRIELGEVEAHVAALDNVYNSAVAVQTTGAGDKVLVGYVSLDDPEKGFDQSSAREKLAEEMPKALVPRICVMDELPVRTSGKVDKAALPWPLPGTGVDAAGLTETEAWLAGLWVDVLGTSVEDQNADFFDLGGSSLAAATLISRIRERYPTIAVRDLYDYPRLEALASRLESIADSSPAASTREQRPPEPVRGWFRAAQTAIQIPMMTLAATPFVAAWLAVAKIFGWVSTPWWLVIALLVVFATPLGRIPIGTLGARLIRPRFGAQHDALEVVAFPRGSAKHLRLWAAQRWLDCSGALAMSGATQVKLVARLLGCRVGAGVDLHSMPPVTGLLTLGPRAAIEPEVDLSGSWVDAHEVHVGPIEVGKDARVGARSTLLPGSVIAQSAHVEAGSTVVAGGTPGGKPMKKGSRWSGSPAQKVGRSKHRFPEELPPRRPYWAWIYAATSIGLALIPGLAGLAAFAVAAGPVIRPGVAPSAGDISTALALAPLAGLVAFAVRMLLTWASVRICSIGLTTGVAPMRSPQGWRVWTVTRLLDNARTHLFPLYASLLTPAWFRALGADVGRDVEISTAVTIPTLTTIKEGAFLADDTLIGTYELGHGWVSTDEVTIGKRSFVGNSGIAAPGRKLGKNSLVAVLSSTPKKAKAGSNWWGSPPERMRRVEATLDSAGHGEGSEEATYRPSISMRARRGLIETLRLAAPMTRAALIALALAAIHLAMMRSVAMAFVLGGLILMGAGLISVVVTVIAKWVCVGRHHAGDHALYSWFVWLNELQDQFVEVVAAPLFFNHALGTGEMNLALRALGVKIGPGAWIESYWFPETDLCHVGAGATVGPGTVVQTHLFQDRVMSLDTVTIADGAALGAQSVALPGSVIGNGALVGPGSLVMRGDHVPPHTQWQGNPIQPW